MNDTIPTEAARLYLQDIGVLEEARGQLVRYFDEVWKRFQDNAKMVPKMAWQHGGKAWTWSPSPVASGRWINVSLAGSMFSVGICDPFAAERPGPFYVYMFCTKKDKDRVMAMTGLESLLQAATRRGFPLDMGDVDEVAVTEIPVQGTLDNLVRVLVDTLRTFADHSIALEEIVRDRNADAPGESTP
jgi:hypothetical protein